MSIDSFINMKYFVVFCLCICSSLSSSVGPRIIGGNEAKDGQFPYAVAVQSTSGTFCGGTLIRDKWVLTSAQCLMDKKTAVVIMGVTDLNKPNPPNVQVEPSEFKVHPDFNAATLENDIALIQLSKAITKTDNLKSVDTLDNQTLGDSASVTAIGWGLTIPGATSISSKLFYVDLTTIPNEECASAYKPLNINLPKNIVCTSSPQGKGICQGDGGGPLIRKDKDGKAVLVGVTSLRHHDCSAVYPSGFTRTFEYNKWINDVINSGPKNTPSMVSFGACLTLLWFVKKSLL